MRRHDLNVRTFSQSKTDYSGYILARQVASAKPAKALRLHSFFSTVDLVRGKKKGCKIKYWYIK